MQVIPRKKAYGKRGGFTLVEMLIAIGLFSIVMVFALSVILTVFNSNKKLQALNSVVDNLNLGIDSMVRDIKTGTTYNCGSNADGLPGTMPVSPGSISGCSASTPIKAMSLRSTLYGTSRSVRYSFVEGNTTTPGRIYKQTCAPSVAGNPEVCGPKVDLTSPEINVQKLSFYVSSPDVSTGQPGVFIIIDGTAQVNASEVSNFNIQTFVSQRALNI